MEGAQVGGEAQTGLIFHLNEAAQSQFVLRWKMCLKPCTDNRLHRMRSGLVEVTSILVVLRDENTITISGVIYMNAIKLIKESYRSVSVA